MKSVIVEARRRKKKIDRITADTSEKEKIISSTHNNIRQNHLT